MTSNRIINAHGRNIEGFDPDASELIAATTREVDPYEPAEFAPLLDERGTGNQKRHKTYRWKD